MITNNDINDTIDTAETPPATATLPTVSASGNGNSNDSDSTIPRTNNIFTCDICHKNYKYIGNNLSRAIKYSIKVCPECDAKLPGSGSKHFRCITCGTIYRNGAPNSKFCPSCTWPSILTTAAYAAILSTELRGHL